MRSFFSFLLFLLLTTFLIFVSVPEENQENILLSASVNRIFELKSEQGKPLISEHKNGKFLQGNVYREDMEVLSSIYFQPKTDEKPFTLYTENLGQEEQFRDAHKMTVDNGTFILEINNPFDRYIIEDPEQRFSFTIENGGIFYIEVTNQIFRIYSFTGIANYLREEKQVVNIFPGIFFQTNFSERFDPKERGLVNLSEHDSYAFVHPANPCLNHYLQVEDSPDFESSSEECEEVSLEILNAFQSDFTQKKESFEEAYSELSDKFQLISSSSDEFSESMKDSFYFLNLNKKSIFEINELFSSIKSLVNPINKCHKEDLATTRNIFCRVEHIRETIRVATSYDPDITKKTLKIVKTYYILHSFFIKHPISVDPFHELMSGLLEGFGAASWKHEISQIFYNYHQEAIAGNTLASENLENRLNNYLKNLQGKWGEKITQDIYQDSIGLWYFLTEYFASDANVTSFSLELASQMTDLGKVAINNINPFDDRNAIISNMMNQYIVMFKPLQEKIEKGYFEEKNRILYLAQETYVQSIEDESGETIEKEINIIQEFANFNENFTESVSFMTENVSEETRKSFDENEELRIMAGRLTWMSCIFRNNKVYVKKPPVCRRETLQSKNFPAEEEEELPEEETSLLEAFSLDEGSDNASTEKSDEKEEEKEEVEKEEEETPSEEDSTEEVSSSDPEATSEEDAPLIEETPTSDDTQEEQPSS